MIIYNIRKNGPYEKDKFILNIGQLHNKVEKEKKTYKSSDIHLQLQALENMVESLINEDSLANQILLIEKGTEDITNG